MKKSPSQIGAGFFEGSEIVAKDETKQKKTRQRNGTGTVVERKDGIFEYRVSMGIGIDGKKLRKSFYGKTSKDAIDKYKEWLKNSDNVPIEKVSTVGEWADKWLKIYKEGNISYITYSDYAGYIKNHIKPKLGSLKLEQVRPAHINQFFRGLTKTNKKGEPLPGTKLSDSAQRKIKILLDNIFDSAIENRFCKTNPAQNIKLEKKPQKEVEIFKQSEIDAILNYVPVHKDGTYIAILLYSGLRIGELLALQWTDVDTTKGIITVRRALKHTKDGDVVGDTTKGKRIRQVPISGEIKELINSLPRTSIFVVPRENGENHTHSSFNTIYNGFFNDLNANLAKENPESHQVIPLLSAHKCRHSFATYSAKAGIPLSILQKMLGHAQIGTTQIYINIDTSDLTSNISKLTFSK